LQIVRVMRKTIITLPILIYLTLGFLKKSTSQVPFDPESLQAVIFFLSKDAPDELKLKIKATEDDSLKYLVRPWNFSQKYSTILTWVEYPDSTKFKNYFKKNKIDLQAHQQQIILLIFKNHLNGRPIDSTNIINKFRKIEEQWAKEDLVRYTTDTLRGMYIPFDLDNCLKYLDSIWSDSIKIIAKSYSEDRFVGGAHLGVGMWMRNSWGLWNGSRLKKYFNDMEIHGADNMSNIILTSYHRHLNGKPVNLKDQTASLLHSFKISAYPPKSSYPNGLTTSDYFSTLHFSKEEVIHYFRNKKTQEVWIYGYYHGWANTKQEDFDYFDRKLTRRKIKIFFRKHKTSD
jgi:hypothetical protein